MDCPACGAENPDGKDSCIECGRLLPPSSAPVTVAEAASDMRKTPLYLALSVAGVSYSLLVVQAVNTPLTWLEIGIEGLVIACLSAAAFFVGIRLVKKSEEQNA